MLESRAELHMQVLVFRIGLIGMSVLTAASQIV